MNINKIEDYKIFKFKDPEYSQPFNVIALDAREAHLVVEKKKDTFLLQEVKEIPHEVLYKFVYYRTRTATCLYLKNREHVLEALYRKKNGQFFLYECATGESSSCANSILPIKITNFTPTKAREYLERRLSPADFVDLLGPVDEWHYGEED